MGRNSRAQALLPQIPVRVQVRARRHKTGAKSRKRSRPGAGSNDEKSTRLRHVKSFTMAGASAEATFRVGLAAKKLDWHSTAGMTYTYQTAEEVRPGQESRSGK